LLALGGGIFLMSEVPLHLLEARGDEAAELGARGQVVQDRPERFQPLQCQTRLVSAAFRGYEA